MSGTSLRGTTVHELALILLISVLLSRLASVFVETQFIVRALPRIWVLTPF